jgi:hypothetical protein
MALNHPFYDPKHHLNAQGQSPLPARSGLAHYTPSKLQMGEMEERREDGRKSEGCSPGIAGCRDLIFF